MKLEKTYNPKEFEKRIYKMWEESGAFHAEVNKEKKPFTIMMPPPNVTGKLHIGHALNNTIQDILIRFKRMQGYEALWMPGMDHASISTEAKVVEKLAADGKCKSDMTREEFLEEAWAWTKEYGGTIKTQLKELGVSCDWERERFTLDEGLSEAVLEEFVRMYHDGLIYEGDRIVNYCVHCGTAISDAEVEHEDMEGALYHIRYPYEDGSGFIEVATTRPETMLGDLAVAVHPEDERYRNQIGKLVILPLVGRKIPVIADEYVDPEYGTGAVKITPSHDPNDFEVGKRAGLGQCIAIDRDGKIAEGYGEYSGLDRFVARKKIIEALKTEGFFIREEKINHAVGHCERCGTVIEPLVSTEWFVAMERLAKRAKEAYTSGKMTITPDRFGKVYVHWLDTIRDWCISRQLYWGHRIPVYTCSSCGTVVCAKEKPHTCEHCGHDHFDQDARTLDTWFSSALWPFSTLGWPEKTPELDYFYPTSVLVTGSDILFFWVIRMVFSGLYALDKIPFHDVYFTGLVRDSEGRKMSKSLGNGVDPLEVISQYGADALRFTLITGNSPGNDMRFYWERVEASRNFANKLWNASRFVLMHLENGVGSYDACDLAVEDRYILGVFGETLKQATKNLENKEIGLAAAEIYDFVWSKYCDWYIEMVKPRLYAEEDTPSKRAARGTLRRVLDGILSILHPFMPFITEEIYGVLHTDGSLLINADWPDENDYKIDVDASRAVAKLIETVTEIRNLRAQLNVGSKRRSDLFIVANEEVREDYRRTEGLLKALGFANTIHYLQEDPQDPKMLRIILSGARIHLPLSDLVDIDKEKKRLAKECEKIESEIKRAKGKLANKGFVDKAPAQVVEEEQKKLAAFEDQLTNLRESLEKLN